MIEKTIVTDKERYQQMKDKLDSVGPGFCLAKWNQVTMHLGTGLNHSCHHPSPHKISEKEVLRGGATFLHNTMFKKNQWRQMLSGQRPKECDYCWKIEDTGTNSFSDRVFKSVEPWAAPTFDDIKNSNWLDNYYPRYVEVSFSNRCNFKCLYCAPNFSSRWNQEAKQYGPVDIMGYKMNYPIDEKHEKWCLDPENNPLVKAFWEWWPNLIQNLHSLRVTGGEPLLVSETYKMIEYIVDHPEEAKNLKFFAINTNLGMSDEQFERFLELSKKLSDIIPEYVIFTSIESGKEAAEYVRFGLDYDKFWERVDRILEVLPKMTICLMATYNVLSITTYADVIRKVTSLKKKYPAKFLETMSREEGKGAVNVTTTTSGDIEVRTILGKGLLDFEVIDSRTYGTPIMLDTSYLRYPSFLDVHTAPKHLRTHIETCVDLVKRFPKGTVIWKRYEPGTGHEFQDRFQIGPGYCEMEIEKVQRLLDYFDSDLEKFNVDHERALLKAFLEEEDRRRNTDYQKIFKSLKL